MVNSSAAAEGDCSRSWAIFVLFARYCIIITIQSGADESWAVPDEMANDVKSM